MRDTTYEAPGNPSKVFPLKLMADCKVSLNGGWLIHKILPSRGLVIIYGPSGVGKSFLSLSLAAAIASGQSSFAGRRVRQAGVVSLAAEAGSAFETRAAALHKKMGLDERVELAVITVAPNLGGAANDKQDLIVSIERGAQACGFSPKVFFVDTLARVAGGINENDAGAASSLINNCESIAAHFGGVCVLVHHSGKNLESGMRGSSALFAACDAVIEIGETEGQKRAEITKSKEGESGLSFGFDLETIELGQDDFGETVTTCCVNNISELQKTFKKAKPKKSTPPSLGLWLDIFDACLAVNGKTVRPFKDGPEVRAVERETVRSAFYQRRGDESIACKRTAFNRGLNGVLDRKLVFASVTTEGAILWKA